MLNSLEKENKKILSHLEQCVQEKNINLKINTEMKQKELFFEELTVINHQKETQIQQQ